MEEIYKYICQENKNAALKTINGIYEKIYVLQNFPRIGYLHKELLGKEIRIIFFGHYRIVYMLENNDIVEILGIFHGAMEFENYLKEY